MNLQRNIYWQSIGIPCVAGWRRSWNSWEETFVLFISSTNHEIKNLLKRRIWAAVVRPAPAEAQTGFALRQLLATATLKAKNFIFGFLKSNLVIII